MSNELRLSFIIEAIDRATGPVRRIAEAVKAPAAAVRAAMSGANEIVQKVSHSYEGMAALVGGGFEVKELVKENEFFERLRINSGKSAEEVETLRHLLLDTARTARVAPEELMAGFKSMREGGAPIEFISDNVGNLATAIQRLNGQGEDLGQLYATLRRFGGLEAPDQFMRVLATIREQLVGVPGGMEQFVNAAGPLLSTYASIGHTGEQAAREVGALYAVIAPGAKSPREALSATQSLLALISTPSSARELQGLGIDVYGGSTPEESAANQRNNRTLPVTQILQDLLKRYQSNPYQFNEMLGPEFARALRVPLGEMRDTGSSPTLAAKLAVPGDTAKFIAQAAEAGRGLTGSLNARHVALKQVGETMLATPLQWFADILARNTGLVAGFLTALAGVAVLGIFSGWLTSIVAAAGLFAPAVAAVTGAVGSIIALRAGYGVMAAFNLVMAANPIGLVIVAATALAGAAYLVYEKWEPIKEFFASLWEGVKQAFDSAWEYIRPIVDLITDSAGKVLGVASSVGGFFKHGADAVGGAIEAGKALLPPLIFGSGQAAAGQSKGEVDGQIVVRFENAPPGMRTEIRGDPGIGLELQTGYALGIP